MLTDKHQRFQNGKKSSVSVGLLADIGKNLTSFMWFKGALACLSMKAERNRAEKAVL